MATDITIDEPSGAESKTFEAFARDALPNLARALAVVADDEEQAAAAVAAAARAVHEGWDAIGHSPEREFYAAAMRQLIEHRSEREPSASEVTLPPACLVAYYGLDWPIGDIAACLGLPADEVMAMVEEAAIDHPAGLDEDLPSHTKQQLAEAKIQLPDTTAMARVHQAQRRRSRLIIGAVCGAGLITLLIAFGQFGTGRDRTEPALAPTAEPRPPTAALTPGVPRLTPPPSAATVTALRQAVPGSAESAEAVVTEVPPDLIADDGLGGFVGVRAGEDQEPAAVVLTSPLGSEWRAIGGLNLGPAMLIDRFERSGDRFAAWISGVTTPSDEVIGTVAVTPDFEQWSFLEVVIDEPAPRGLKYDFEIAEVGFRDSTILALVTMTVEIDFPALQLIESNTCGHSIEPELVIVKLCNGGEIDVLSVSGIDRLPTTTRLFTGTEGFNLTETDTPFLQDAVGLLTTAESILLTDETGKWIASSIDGQTWAQPTISWPPGVIATAATNNNGHIVSLVLDPEPVLYTTSTDESFAQPLADLIPSLSAAESFDTTIAGTGGTWVVYVSTSDSAWFVTSLNGERWQTSQIAEVGEGEPTLFVGAERAIVQWLQGETTTIVIDFG